MSHNADTQAEEALLWELAQLGMDMVRRVNEAALATTDVEQLVALTGAFHQMGRGVRQSLALRARFAAGTVAPERAHPAETTPPPRPAAERPERSDWNEHERPDWNERLATLAEPLDLDTSELETLDSDPDVVRTRIRRDLTVVSRTPALAAIPALRTPAAALAGRAALLGGAALRLVDTS